MRKNSLNENYLILVTLFNSVTLRRSFVQYASILNITGIFLTLFIAEREINDGISLISNENQWEKSYQTCNLLHKLMHKKFSAKINVSDTQTTSPVNTNTVTVTTQAAQKTLNHVTFDICLISRNKCFKNEYLPSIWVMLLNIILTISTIILLYCTYKAYQIETSIYKLDNSISPELNCVSYKTYFWFSLEFLVQSIHPLTYTAPWFYKIGLVRLNFYTHPSLYFLVLLRIPYLFRFVISQSMMCENITLNTISKLININMTTMTLESWRLIWRRFAAEIIVFQVIGMSVIGAWCLRLAEGRFAILTCSLDQVKFSFNDMFWLVPITMTTIGYGDIYPVSKIGKIVALVIGFFGIVVSAFLVSIICNLFLMTRRERVIFNVLRKDEASKRTQHLAAILIQRIWRRHRMNRVDRLNKERKESFSLSNGLSGRNSHPIIIDNKLSAAVQANSNPAHKLSTYSNSLHPFTFRKPKPSIESTTSSEESERVLLIRNISILKAITNFRQARIQNKYIESDHVDITDVGIKQSVIESEIKYFGKKTEEVVERVSKVEKKLDLILEMLTAQK